MLELIDAVPMSLAILPAFINPATLTIAAQLANMGASHFAGKDARKLRKKNEAEAQRSNLSNALFSAAGRSPSSRPDLQDFKPGKGASFLSSIGSVLGTGAQVMSLAEQAKALTAQTAGRNLTNELTGLQIEALKGDTARKAAEATGQFGERLGGVGADINSKIPVRVDSLGKGTSTMQNMPIGETLPPAELLAGIGRGQAAFQKGELDRIVKNAELAKT